MRPIIARFSVLTMLLASVNVFASDDLSHHRSVVVESKTDFLKAVAANSPYSTVIVKGAIADLGYVLIKDDLTIKGLNKDSQLIAAPSEDLLVVGKNDEIKDLRLTVDDNSNFKSITNRDERSFGSLSINHIVTNGHIGISLSDTSTDSVFSIQDSLIDLGNAPSTIDNLTPAIDVLLQNNSRLTVAKIDNNIVQSKGELNVGIYNHAYTGATIYYSNGLKNNIISTQGHTAHDIYNYADGGIIEFEKGISGNHMHAEFINADNIENHATEQGQIIIDSTFSNNTIETSGLNGYAILNLAEENGIITFKGKFKDNLINTSGVSAYGLFNNASSGGKIDYSSIKIEHNNITVTYPATNAILNYAEGNGSIINYGLGDPQLIINMLDTNNQLSSDAQHVRNNVEDGGMIS